MTKQLRVKDNRDMVYEHPLAVAWFPGDEELVVAAAATFRFEKRVNARAGLIGQITTTREIERRCSNLKDRVIDRCIANMQHPFDRYDPVDLPFLLKGIEIKTSTHDPSRCTWEVMTDKYNVSVPTKDLVDRVKRPDDVIVIQCFNNEEQRVTVPLLWTTLGEIRKNGDSRGPYTLLFRNQAHHIEELYDKLREQ